ncbi:M28 family metallopeptidase [Shewanella xiamenensis]|uniref:M28 family metallopeptidase n=1 Tax=Shewanella xiamenensis TaxID=332186 RepID=UPI001F060EC3|nr:M28 family metallopeptidase [Shewanella xiamenensis]MDI5836435.1 M28 family metallopeptidase [Shewanella xiamenensis]MDI5844295.1 M28 family metallopeptidase [Shewanella xiamenensis]MDI5852251.1 M28 family metallopeptidase [Shewanella xiamenensis]MDI5856229.1 M28 family metallopeptidase [Shewanella xiamenensis]MDI5863664.1 M28 family metallopeptidase [Shewanella xiamenensis]
MKPYQTTLITGLFISGLSACQTHIETPVKTDIPSQLQQTALASSIGYDIVESLTVEVGPRLAGSPKDIIAVNWAMNKLTSLGFDKVYKEPVQVPIWERGEAKAKIISPVEQPLVITALGGSIATPVTGIRARIARFDSLEALQQANPDDVKGKIAFIDQKTDRHITGEGYGKSVGGRSKGAVAAAQKGAVAIVIRSIGTDHDRMAHTGVMRYQDGVAKIPAAAMSNPDADLVDAMLKRDPNAVLELHMSPKDLGTNTSYNVIAEVTGSSKPNEIVLIGAHLDSWDEGTGAIDDGAGVAIVTAAAKHIQDLPQKPARTVRVVLYAAEEIGLVGGKAYAEAHKAELPLHYIAAESDFGAGPIYQIDTKVSDNVFAQVQESIKPMTYNGVALGNNQASGGPDVSMLPALGVPVASLRQDGHDYFDYHHTPNDTLDKINPKALAQNVAAYAQFAYIMANSNLVLTPISTESK